MNYYTSRSYTLCFIRSKNDRAFLSLLPSVCAFLIKQIDTSTNFSSLLRSLLPMYGNIYMLIVSHVKAKAGQQNIEKHRSLCDFSLLTKEGTQWQDTQVLKYSCVHWEEREEHWNISSFYSFYENLFKQSTPTWFSRGWEKKSTASLPASPPNDNPNFRQAAPEFRSRPLESSPHAVAHANSP